MRMHPFLGYTLARLGLMAATAGVLYLVGLRSWLLAFAALVVSLPLSWLVLRRQRQALGSYLASRSERRTAEKAELRAALRGDDALSTTPATTGANANKED